MVDFSVVMTDAERGAPSSSASSPKWSPGPWALMMISLPSSLLRNTLIAPVIVIASGVVELIEPNKEMKSRIDASQGTDLVAAYANEGVWYDALDTISSMIDKSPADQQLVAIRATLLDQVGLQAVSQK